MKPTADNLSPQQSLDIITSMISQAKGNVRMKSFYFLLWGWVVMLANVGMFTLYQFHYRHFYIVWLLAIPAWILSFYKSYRHRRADQSPTHLDRISGWLWTAFGIIIFTLVAFGYKINFQLNPVILLVCAIPTFVSGIIIKFKPLIIGGILFWIFGIICFLIPMPYQFLAGAAAIACGYLVPGYILKNKQED
jgi:hypothetical protein